MNTSLACSPVRRTAGFSLLELLIALAVIGLITAIALPTYQESTLRSGRADGKSALMQVAAAQERYYSANNTYSTNAAPFANPPEATIDSPDGKYEISVSACSGGTIANCFVATATPQGSQTNDVCTSLTIDSTGVRGATGAPAEECWQR